MKRIEEIERLGAEELGRIASDASVKVPDGLEGKILNALTASELEHGRQKRKVGRFVLVPASLALAAALTVGINYHTLNAVPTDTFSSPEEAYARLEETLGYISGKISKGAELADAALPHLNQASETLDKFHKNR